MTLKCKRDKVTSPRRPENNQESFGLMDSGLRSSQLGQGKRSGKKVKFGILAYLKWRIGPDTGMQEATFQGFLGFQVFCGTSVPVTECVWVPGERICCQRQI